MYIYIYLFSSRGGGGGVYILCGLHEGRDGQHSGGLQAHENLPLCTRQHPLILPQDANRGLWETTNINWEGAVNNIKTSVMSPLHNAALSESGFKRTLGCSNLRGSSLTPGDLHCSFAPAHRYQMISSSTSNLLTLIPHSQSTIHPSQLLFPFLLPFLSILLSLLPLLLLLLPPPSSVSQSLCLLGVCVGEFRDGDRSRAIPLKGVCACVLDMTFTQINKKNRLKEVDSEGFMCPCSYFPTAPY